MPQDQSISNQDVEEIFRVHIRVVGHEEEKRDDALNGRVATHVPTPHTIPLHYCQTLPPPLLYPPY